MSNLVYSDIYRRGNRLMVRAIDQDTGERVKQSVDYEPFIYTETKAVSKAVARGLRDEYLERMDFSTIGEFIDFQERYKDTDGFKLFGCRDPIFQYTASAYPGDIEYKYKYIRGNIIDIEVESGNLIFDDSGKAIDIKAGPFPKPEDADYPVTAVTIYDTKNSVFITLGLEVFQGHYMGTFKHDASHPKIGKCKVLYKGFDDEKKLLIAMVELFAKMEPDFISGWNSNTFDNVYIINRVKKLLGDEWAKRISPWNYIHQRTYTGSFGKEEVTYDIYGVAQLDFKELVEKHGYIELANKKLNTAAEHYLGEGKLDYDDAKTLPKLYFLDYPKYITYNIQDVNLIVKMEAKLKFFELVYTLMYMCHCNAKDTLATVSPWSARTYEKLHNRGQEPELKGVYQGETEFIGGFVQEPVPGLRKWGVSIDAQSLYPHNIMQFNLGSETILTDREAYNVRMMLVKELDEEPPTPYIRHLKECIRNGALINDFYWEEIYEFKTLKKLNLIMAPNCTFYKRDRVSVFAEACDETYNGRKIVKGKMLAKEQELVNLKQTSDYTQAQVEELEAAIASLNNLQQGLKILMNSLFGAIGNKWFREYFDVRVAEAITTIGQNGIQYMARKVNEYLREKMGLDPKDKNMTFTFYSDTDSIYMTLEPLVNRQFTADEQQNVEAVIDWMDDMFKKDVGPLLIKWAEELAQALNCPQNKLIFKREALFTAGIWTAKKRYALMVLDNEGVRYAKPKLKFTGLEAKKSDCPAFCRQWLKECYEIALTKNEDAIHERVKVVKGEYMQKPIHQIAAPKSVNDIEKWLVPNTFMVNKGTPAQVKAAVNYNRMVHDLKYEGKPIVSGDKLLYVPLKKGAPYGMEIMGFPEFLPEEFDMHRWVDKNESFNKFFIAPLTNFLKAINWAHEPRASCMDFFDM